jgi:predicted MPP superfamily phosphohydrolase
MIRLLSDLHLEFNAFPRVIERIGSSQVKYTILAGDITNNKCKEAHIPALARELKKHSEHVIYIAGNHEYYYNQNKTYQDLQQEYKALCDKAGIVWLENSAFATDNYTFYGTTLWSECNDAAYDAMNDKYAFSKQDILKMHRDAVSKLDRFVTTYYDPKPLIVVSHHLPSYSLVSQKYKTSPINSGFASNLDHLIRRPIYAWVHGHSHVPTDTVINGVLVKCNAHGYPREVPEIYPDCKFS